MNKLNTIISELNSSNNIRFGKLIAICKNYFGEPRIHGSHHIFKTCWIGDPRINLQKDKGGVAKKYQVNQVIQALQKLEVEKDGK
jgi:hypothetical protein